LSDCFCYWRYGWLIITWFWYLFPWLFRLSSTALVDIFPIAPQTIRTLFGIFEVPTDIFGVPNWNGTTFFRLINEEWNFTCFVAVIYVRSFLIAHFKPATPTQMIVIGEPCCLIANNCFLIRCFSCWIAYFIRKFFHIKFESFDIPNKANHTIFEVK
jgi:hypothetical protein